MVLVGKTGNYILLRTDGNEICRLDNVSDLPVARAVR